MADVYVYSGAAGAGTGADWTNAFTTLAAALAAKAAGDKFWVADDHTPAAVAGNINHVSPGTDASPCYIYCVRRVGGSVPPVSADLRTTAVISNSGANNIVNSGVVAECYGIEFKSGSGSSNGSLNLQGNWKYVNCKGTLNTTSGSAAINVSGGKTELVNFVATFGAAGQKVSVSNARLIWRDTASAIGGTVPTNLVQSGNNSGSIQLVRLDLSAAGSGKNIVAAAGQPFDVEIIDCKLGSGVTVSASPTSPAINEVFLSRSDSTAVNYGEQHVSYEGVQTDETVVVRTGGASNGTTAKSRKLSPSANARWQKPFEALPIAKWNDNSGASKTATVEGIAFNITAIPKNDEIWCDFAYLGDASSPIATLVSGTKADGLATGSNQTASTQAWDSLATARANSTAYNVGDIRKVASNPGRLFYCTGAGTSAGSEPAGYATAVDGDAIIDGTATFRAGYRFSMSAAFTPQQKGVVYAYLKAGLASQPYYIDPKISIA